MNLKLSRMARVSAHVSHGLEFRRKIRINIDSFSERETDMKRHLLSLLVFLLAAPAVWAQFMYTITNGTVTITAYTNSSGSVTIPTSIKGYPVTAIAPSAFTFNDTLTSLSIPVTVTNIGTNAFYGCGYLTSINVSAGNPAFASINGILCNQNQTILLQYPGGKTASSYTVPATVTNIAANAFAECSNPITVTLGSNVVSIGDSAFNEAGVTSVSLTNGLVSIGEQAFFESELASLSLPATVTNLGNEAFVDCPLRQISVAASNPFYSSANNVLFAAGQTTLLQYSASGEGNSYVIPNTVTNIADGAFACSGLASITFGTNVQSIGDKVFYNCYLLQTFNFDDHLAKIGSEDFVDLYMTNFTIPPGVTTISNEAFLECTYLATITIPAGVTNFGNSVFRSCFALGEIEVDPRNPCYSSLGGVMFNKAGTTLVEFPEGSSVTSYTIPNGVTNIQAGAFSVCGNLNNVVAPKGLLSIGDEAFEACFELTNLTLPASVSSIGVSTFAESLELQNIALGPEVTVIPDYAFCDCPRLTNFSLANGVTSIGRFAFFDTGFSSIVIPASVTNIDEMAFSGCDWLTSVYFPGEPPVADGTILPTYSVAYYLPGMPGWGTNYAGAATAFWTLPYPTILAGSAATRGGQFGFTISWATNVPVTVEACANLAAPVWQPVQTTSLNNGVCPFTDSNAGVVPCRFYRVRSQ